MSKIEIKIPDEYLEGSGLLPNASFESGDKTPDGWELQGGLGAWFTGGAAGARAIAVTGKGEDSSFWVCKDLKLKPRTTYRLGFSLRREPGATSGCAITGLSCCNRDFTPGDKWATRSFVFVTPNSMEGVYLRLGQWHADGTYLYDNVSLAESSPVHSRSGDMVLGEGERIENGVYYFNAPLNSEGSNYHRCLESHTAGFNSYRWVFSGDNFVIYKHEVAGLKQESASVEINVGYYEKGNLLVHASAGRKTWTEIGRIGSQKTETFKLPSEMFPADAVYIRLSMMEPGATREDSAPGALQVHGYSYEAKAANQVADFTGATRYFDVLRDTGALKVVLDSVPAMEQEDRTIKGRISSTGAGIVAPLSVILETSHAGAAPGQAVKLIAADVSAEKEFSLPLDAGGIGVHGLLLAVADAKGQIQYLARSSVYVPSLLASDYGYAVYSDEKCDLWWCESTYKISRFRTIPKERGPVVRITAAKDEYEPFQIAIRPKSDLKDVTVKFSNLAGEGGASIPASEITIDLVEWLYVRSPSDAAGCVGWWPDPLPHYTGPFNAPGGRNSVIWATVHVPKNAKPGTYAGTVTLQATDGWSAMAPLEVRVFDFEMPAERHCFGTFGMSPGQIRRYHNLETAEELDQVWDLYMKNAAEHRLGPYNPMALHPYKAGLKGANWHGGEVVPATGSGDRTLFIRDDSDASVIAADASDLIPIDPNKEYRISWKALTATPGQDYLITLNTYDAGGQWISGNNIDLACRGTGRWRSEERVVKSKTDKGRFFKLTIRPALWSEKGELVGSAWFDDVSLKELPDGPELVKGGDFGANPESLKVELDFTEFDKSAKRYLDEMGFPRFTLPVSGLGYGTFHSRSPGELFGFKAGTQEYESLMTQYLGGIQDHLEKNGWLGKEYIYWFDEPDPKDYEFVRDGMATIKRHGPKLCRMLTEEPTEALYGAVDLWCPLTGSFDAKVCRERQAAGEQIMWYVCTGPKEPYAGLFIDHPAVDMRVWLWQTFQNDVEGLLVWETTYWTSPCAYPEPDAQNPWEDPMAYVSGYDTPVGQKIHWGNGDGRYLYPPNREGVKSKKKYVEGPVNSFRWEMLREGAEDFEYLWTLRELIRDLKNKGVSGKEIEDAAKLIEVPDSISRSLTEFTLDPKPIFAQRMKIAEAIERLKKMESGSRK
ncbi:MAG TPA: DUF6067 family protein [Candidatus Brocadiia bacterium]|nr:DUF6067 family protein [Candidatus Brocadiia bacterium]